MDYHYYKTDVIGYFMLYGHRVHLSGYFRAFWQSCPCLII